MPLAMIMLVVMTGLMVSFAVLARSEPTIAGNQMATAQALRLADSGVQRAIWALNNPANGNGIDSTTMTYGGASAGGNYDGAHYVSLGTTGGFTVLVQWQNPTNGTWERTVTAVGWTPSNGDALNSHRKIQAILQKGVVPPLDPPCVVCVAGEMQVNGSSADFIANTNGCPGSTPPQFAIQSVQAVQYNAHPNFTGYGTSGTSALNTTTNTSQFKYTADALAQFKAYAQAKGTYYTGAVTSLPTGPGPHVVFIDTTDGSTFTNSTPTSKDGSLSLSGNNTFNGAVFVAGSVNVAGNTTSLSRSYEVIWNRYAGFFQPVDNGAVNVAQPGSSIPVKFSLTGASAGITNLAARISVARVSNGVAGSYVETTSNAAPDGGNLFRYSGGQYIYNLSTKGMATGTWSIRVDLGDGVAHAIVVSLK